MNNGSMNVLRDVATGQVDQANKRPEPYVRIAEVVSFNGFGPDENRNQATVTVRDKISKNEFDCRILVDAPGDFAGYPEGTDVVVERLGSLGKFVTGTIYSPDNPSPVGGNLGRRFRIGDMVIEHFEDSQGRRVVRIGHQPDDGADHEAAFIVREDGSIEGYSSGNYGFCFQEDSFYVSGMGVGSGTGTPGTGAPGGDGTGQPEQQNVSGSLAADETARYEFRGDLTQLDIAPTDAATVLVDGEEINPTTIPDNGNGGTA